MTQEMPPHDHQEADVLKQILDGEVPHQEYVDKQLEPEKEKIARQMSQAKRRKQSGSKVINYPGPLENIRRAQELHYIEESITDPLKAKEVFTQITDRVRHEIMMIMETIEVREKKYDALQASGSVEPSMTLALIDLLQSFLKSAVFSDMSFIDKQLTIYQLTRKKATKIPCFIDAEQADAAQSVMELAAKLKDSITGFLDSHQEALKKNNQLSQDIYTVTVRQRRNFPS